MKNPTRRDVRPGSCAQPSGTRFAANAFLLLAGLCASICVFAQANDPDNRAPSAARPVALPALTRVQPGASGSGATAALASGPAFQGDASSPIEAGAGSTALGAALASSGSSPAGVAYTFQVHQGERLSAALARYLAARGWSLEWNDSQDFQLEHGYELDLRSFGMPAAVARILAPYRLSAVLHSPNSQRVVAVGAARGRFVIEDPAEGQP